MNNKYIRGSEWRKWDLHFHTPSSYDYGDKSTTNQQIIDTLIQNEIAVVAITDHHIIDIDRIEELRKLAKGRNLTILPGIEFLSDSRGSEPIHYIGIFSEDSNIKTIWEDIKVKTNISKIERERVNPNEIYCNLLETIELIKQLGGVVSIHAGRKHSSIECITNSLPHAMAQKKDIASTVDIYELGKESDQEGYRSVVFPAINKFIPMILCSDNHDIKKYCLKQNCWIKADPTFAGLKQIIYEPSDRVRIQAESPDFDFEKSPFTEININDNVQVFNDDKDNVTFAKSVIPLNNNLISIIGGRGSGKSVLVNYLANGLGKNLTNKPYTNNANFSIKRKTSIKDPEQTYILGEDQHLPFMYISQSEIKDIVGNPTIFTNNIRKTIGVTGEYSVSSEYISSAEVVINEYFRIIKILNANNTSVENKLVLIEKEIKKYEDFIKNVTSEDNKIKLEKYTKNVKQLNEITNWKKRTDALQEKITNYCSEVNAEISEINSSIKDLAIPKIDSSETLQYISEVLCKRIENAKTKVCQDVEHTKNEFSSYSGDLTTLLGNVTSFQTKVSDLIKERDNLNNEKAKYTHLIDAKFNVLGGLIEQSINKYTEIINTQWTKFRDGHAEMSKEMKDLLRQILDNDSLNVIVEVKFDADEFYKLLATKLDGRTYNISNLRSILRIESLEDFYHFVKQDINAVKLFDENSIRTDLRNKLLDLIYIKYTSFIMHKIIVRSGEKPITKLSHGQQGTIYLRMKLAANLFTETIIYDQPEDDLDNKFIMTELVELFRRIKKYRQVIIVSHNANLVVNADSEQIIIAENIDGVLSYTAGSLEDSFINEKICDILEGGSRAFRDRERKYNLM